jgi:hypothetical protein
MEDTQSMEGQSGMENQVGAIMETESWRMNHPGRAQEAPRRYP